jgi:hypothetical protein
MPYACRTAGGDVGLVVADQHALRQVEPEVCLRSQNHSGIRLAVVRLAPIVANPFRRVKRAVIDAANWDAALAKPVEHPRGQCPEIVFGIVAAADSGLVRDHDGHEAGVPSRAAQFEDPGRELEILDSVNVAFIDVDHSVAIEK